MPFRYWRRAGPWRKAVSTRVPPVATAWLFENVDLSAELPQWWDNMLYDPQTTRPLLVACDPAGADEILAMFYAEGFDAAAVIGKCTAGDPVITVG